MERMKLSRCDSAGYVALSYDRKADGKRLSRTFYLPSAGGHVQECFEDGSRAQVCEGLERFGGTLTCGNREALPDLIRAEYRRMRRVEASKTSYEYCISTED